MVKRIVFRLSLGEFVLKMAAKFAATFFLLYALLVTYNLTSEEFGWQKERLRRSQLKYIGDFDFCAKMSGIERKTIFDLCSDCQAEILKYLSSKDLISLKNAAAGFHDAVWARFRRNGEVSLHDFKSIEETRAFFRDMPFKLRKLNVHDEYFETDDSLGFLKEVDLGSVTHLAMETAKVEDPVCFKEIMGKLCNVRSLTLHARNIIEANMYLDSIEAGTIEEISIIKSDFSSQSGVRSQFLTTLRKHGSRLRVFKLIGLNYPQSFQQVVDTLVESAPNLESLTLYRYHDCSGM